MLRIFVFQSTDISHWRLNRIIFTLFHRRLDHLHNFLLFVVFQLVFLPAFLRLFAFKTAVLCHCMQTVRLTYYSLLYTDGAPSLYRCIIRLISCNYKAIAHFYIDNKNEVDEKRNWLKMYGLGQVDRLFNANTHTKQTTQPKWIYTL